MHSGLQGNYSCEDKRQNDSREIAHAKEVRDAEKYAEMKAAFDRQLREASTKKTGKNIKILDHNKYVEKIHRLEDLKTGQVKWTPNDYVLSKAHRIINVVTGPGSVIKSLVKKNQQLVFMYNNQSLKTSVWLLYIKTSFDHANGYYV